LWDLLEVKQLISEREYYWEDDDSEDEDYEDEDW
jgi:hypothetical protein